MNTSKTIKSFLSYELTKEDLNNDLISINIKSGIDFVLEIKHINKKTALSCFLLEMKDHINGSITILSLFTFKNPKGPKYDFNFSITGVFSNSSPQLSTKEKINLEKLENENFFQNDSITLIINMKGMPMNENFSKLTTREYSNQIEKNILFDDQLELTINCISWLTNAASSILLEQPSLLLLDVPLIVIGDLNGSFNDLLQIFDKFGLPRTVNYLFLGNYIKYDKNQSGDESDKSYKKFQFFRVISLLLAYKIRFPNNIFLLRSQSENSFALHKADDPISKCFQNVFKALPLAAIIGNKIFCSHSGISPLLTDINDINMCKRPCVISDLDPLFFLLNATPNPKVQNFEINENQEISFGLNAVLDFLSRFCFDLVICSHFNQKGFDDTFSNLSLLTIFSSTNIQDNNKGSVIVIAKNFGYSIYSYEALNTSNAKLLPNKMINLYNSPCKLLS